EQRLDRARRRLAFAEVEERSDLLVVVLLVIDDRSGDVDEPRLLRAVALAESGGDSAHAEGDFFEGERHGRFPYVTGLVARRPPRIRVRVFSLASITSF